MRTVRLLAIGILCSLMIASCTVAEVVKTDLRSAPSSREFFVAFCVAKATPGQALIGLAEGSVSSGYQWVQITSYSTSRTVHSPQGPPNSPFHACTRSALVDKASLFI